MLKGNTCFQGWIAFLLFLKNAEDRKNGAFLNQGKGESIYELNQRKIKERIRGLEKEIEKAKNSKIVQSKKIRRDVLLGDTVGFITKLPSIWLEGFESIIQDIRLADLILNVMDDKDIYRKFKEKTAREILVQLEVEHKKNSKCV